MALQKLPATALEGFNFVEMLLDDVCVLSLLYRGNMAARSNIKNNAFWFFLSCCQLIFKDVMLLQFVNVFLQALVYRSHDLLQEEITITLYNMAAVDFDSFYSAFLPRFLGGCEGLTESQKSELGKNFTPDKVCTTRQNKDLHKIELNASRSTSDLRGNLNMASKLDLREISCLVPVRLSLEPSQSIDFGDIS